MSFLEVLKLELKLTRPSRNSARFIALQKKYISVFRYQLSTECATHRQHHHFRRRRRMSPWIFQNKAISHIKNNK